jgi:peptide/nickel transport system substrate-binding protein
MMPSPAGKALLCAAFLATAACAGADHRPAEAAPDEPVYGGIAVIAAPTDIDNANSLVSADRYSQELLRYALFLPLLSYDSAFEYAPALASSWEMLADTGVIVHLRRDVRWHDGRPTSAADVVFTFLRAKDTLTAFPNAEYFAKWKDAEAIDSFNVRFRFEPHADPLVGLALVPIMPRHLLDSIPAGRLAKAAFNKRPIGNGPFRFVEYHANDRWVLEANPDFPPELGGRPYLDRLVWRVIPDGTAQAIEARTRSADLLLTPAATDFATLDAEVALRGIVRTGQQYGFVGWNGLRPPFDDARVRRALSLAIDRKQMVDVMRGGHGTLAIGPVFPGHWAYNERLQPLPFDPDSARALLRMAGISDTGGDSILDLPNGRNFEIDLKYPASSALNRGLAELMQSQLARVGVRVTLRPTDFQVMVADMTSPERKFDAVLMGWASDFRLNLRDLFHSEARSGPYQFASYANAEVDRILDETAVTVDRTIAKPRWDRLQEIMREEQPWTFLYYFPDLYVANERLQGVEMDGRGALVNVARWWVRPGDEQTPVAPVPGDSTVRSQTPGAAPAR